MTISWTNDKYGNGFVVVGDANHLANIKRNNGWTDGDVLARLEDKNANGKVDVGETIWKDLPAAREQNIDAWQTEQDNKAEEKERANYARENFTKNETVVTVGTTATGAALGWLAASLASAKAGAAVGGTAGTAAGGIGAVPGAIVGAVIGLGVGLVSTLFFD